LPELRLSEEADADLVAIHRWSADRFGVDIADAYLLAIDTAFELLRSFPEAGPVRDDLRRPVRSLACRSHRIFYDRDREVLTILRVLNKAMSAERHLT